jgi:hypothetical protein
VKAAAGPVAVAGLALLLAGCGDRSAAPVPAAAARAPAVTRHDAADGIAWFDGGVDAAFALSRRESRPVLLYWGAVWCPPCRQLKSSVFTRRDFIEKSRLFVPVYLDGDSAGAQRQGEVFGVVGYPTVVILSPERRELLRLSGGMDLTQYAQMLDLALGDLQPIDAVLAALPRSGATLPAAVCRRLAWNGWALDEHDAVEAATLSRQIATAAERCAGAPAVERARLAAAAAFLAGTAEEESIEAGKPASDWLVARTGALHAAIGDAGLASAVVDALRWQGAPTFAAARHAGLGAALLARFDALLGGAATSAALDDSSRLDALATRLAAHRALGPDPAADAALAAAALARVKAALAVERDAHARAGVVNAALRIYDTLGRHAEARALVVGELERAATPYYYLADLAAIDEELGDRQAALASYERAWRESRGAATRVQWGAMYLSALLRLAPADATRIRSAGLEVIGEASDGAALYQRTQRRLERLDQALRRWNTDGRQAAVIAALRERMRRGCARDGVEPDVRRRCESFLAGA